LELNIEYRELSGLIPYARNARKHSQNQVSQIAASIKEFGFNSPVLLKDDSTIIAGHGRVMAAEKLGLKKVPCIYLKHLTPTQAKAYGIVDNQLTLNSEWDDELLKLDILDLKSEDFDLDILGFEKDQLDDIIGFSGDISGQTDPDEVPDVEEKDVWVKPGDLFQLGDHRVLCADCTVKENVDRLMDGQKADMVFTDPPYNVASNSKNVAASVSRAMNDLKNSDWDKGFEIEKALEQIKSIIENGSVYIWCSHFLFSRIVEGLSDWAKFTGWNVWSKPNPMPSLMKRHWSWNSELCCYFTIGKHVFNFPDSGHALASWNFNKIHVATEGLGHPTQKPTELCSHVIKHSSNKGQLVLDLFLGSGSTLIACEKTSRKCYGMEIDPHYVQVIIERWEAFSGKKHVKL